MFYVKNKKTQEIPIINCMHYRGFRYGGFGNNIYEDYIVGLANNVDFSKLRSELVRRVLGYICFNFGDALGIELKKTYSPWLYPWQIDSFVAKKAFPYSPLSNPDIICHYSPQGVLSSHINREILWLEGAYKRMRDGYAPEQFGYVTLLRLVYEGKSRYLVLDGNHRIAALHALGHEAVIANVTTSWLCNSAVMRLWPGVISRHFDLSDARKILQRYFFDDNRVLPEAPRQKIIYDEPLLF